MDKDLEKDPEHTGTSNEDEDDELDLDGLDEDEEDEDDSEDDEDDADESEEELTALEKEILEMSEEDLKDPANQAKALEAYKGAKSAIVQKKLWRKRAQDAGWKKNPAKDPEKPAKPAKPSNKADANVALLQRLDRNEFRQDHPEIPRRMVDEIETYAKAKGVSLERALKSPLIQKMVGDKELKERLSKASPSSKHRSPQAKPGIDWATATPAQVAAHRAAIEAKPRGSK